jgi:hypothetical protein
LRTEIDARHIIKNEYIPRRGGFRVHESLTCGLFNKGVAKALKGLKDRRESVSLVGVPFYRNKDIERAVVIDDAQVFASRVVCELSIAVDLAANND